MECDLCQISLSYVHLTTDIWSYRCGQSHIRCSMDWLYMPKNLWVNHSTRLWCVCNWTLFYSLQREIHLHELKKTKNSHWIQTISTRSFLKCLISHVVSTTTIVCKLVPPQSLNLFDIYKFHAYVNNIPWFYMFTLVMSPMLVYTPADRDHFYPLRCIIPNHY